MGFSQLAYFRVRVCVFGRARVCACVCEFEWCVCVCVCEHALSKKIYGITWVLRYKTFYRDKLDDGFQIYSALIVTYFNRSFIFADKGGAYPNGPSCKAPTTG
jgi:hypothetical protein